MLQEQMLENAGKVPNEYIRFGEVEGIKLIGSCPNLDENSRQCKIYPEPGAIDERPSDCGYFKPGGNVCNLLRFRAGLPTLRLPEP